MKKIFKLIACLVLCITIVSAPIIVHAKDTNVITYNLNGGVNNKSNPSKTSKKTITLKQPTKKGYIFKGWYSNSKLTKKVTTVKKNAKNVKLYAKWEAIKYSIKFNGNGSTSGKMSTISNVKYDKNVTLTKNKYTRKNYEFVGWNTKKDGTGKTYKNKEKVKNLTSKNKKAVTLYAKWERKGYKIIYKLDGGKNNKDNPTNYYKIKKTTLRNPTKKYYTFLGWYSDSKYTKKVTTITSSGKGDRTLYAKWIANTYGISFDACGGYTGIKNKNVKYKNAYGTLPTPYKYGYKFLGWYTKKSGGTKVTEKTTMTTAGIKLYAQYEKMTTSLQTLMKKVNTVDEYGYFDKGSKQAEMFTFKTVGDTIYRYIGDPACIWYVNDAIFQYTELMDYDVVCDSKYHFVGTQGSESIDEIRDTCDPESGETKTSCEEIEPDLEGAIPNNYIYFNCGDYKDTDTCEIWRIVGIFDGKIKLVRDEEIESVRFCETQACSWQSSLIRDTLSSMLTKETSKYIKSGTYYGGILHDEIDSDRMYALERTKSIEDTIGLLNKSDIAYATTGFDQTELSWLSRYGDNEWYMIDGTGDYTTTKSARPVVYLSEDLVFASGDGSRETPYVILNKP